MSNLYCPNLKFTWECQPPDLTPEDNYCSSCVSILHYTLHRTWTPESSLLQNEKLFFVVLTIPQIELQALQFPFHPVEQLPADNIYGNGFTVVCSTDVYRSRNMLVLDDITCFIYQLQVFAYVVTPWGVRGQVSGNISSSCRIRI